MVGLDREKEPEMLFFSETLIEQRGQGHIKGNKQPENELSVCLSGEREKYELLFSKKIVSIYFLLNYLD